MLLEHVVDRSILEAFDAVDVCTLVLGENSTSVVNTGLQVTLDVRSVFRGSCPLEVDVTIGLEVVPEPL